MSTITRVKADEERNRDSGDRVSYRLGDQSGLGRGGRTEGCFQLCTLKNWGDGESYWQFQNFHTEGLRQAVSP